MTTPQWVKFTTRHGQHGAMSYRAPGIYTDVHEWDPHSMHGKGGLHFVRYEDAHWWLESFVHQDPACVLWDVEPLGDGDVVVHSPYFPPVSKAYRIRMWNPRPVPAALWYRALQANALHAPTLQHVPPQLFTRAILETLVARDGMAIRYAPPRLLHEEMCRVAVAHSDAALQFVPVRYRTKRVCTAAVEHGLVPPPPRLVPMGNPWLRIPPCAPPTRTSPRVLQHVPWHLRTQRLCRHAVQRDPDNLCVVPHQFRDHEICLTALLQDGSQLPHVPPHVLTPDLLRVAVAHDPLLITAVPTAVWERLLPLRIPLPKVFTWPGGESRKGALTFDPDQSVRGIHTPTLITLAITVVTYRGDLLQCLPVPLRTPLVCEAAVSRDARALAHVPAGCHTLSVCASAVKHCGTMLRHVPVRFRTPAVCMSAVINTGRALAHVPDEHKTYEMCDLAVQRTPSALCEIPSRYQADSDMKLTAALSWKDKIGLAYIPGTAWLASKLKGYSV